MPDTLETALRELRETPSDEFATELDARVAAGFGRGRGRETARRLGTALTTPAADPDAGEAAAPAPAPGYGGRKRRPPRRLPSWLLPAGGFAVAASLAVVVVAGVTMSGEDSMDSGAGGGGGGAVEQAAPPAARERDSGGGSTAAPSLIQPQSGGGTAVPGRNRKVERSASVTLEVEEDGVDAAAGEVSELTNRFGGYVERSEVETADEADFVLRLPVDRLDEAMAGLARIGEVTERRQSTQDITASFNAARAQLQEARALRTSLLRRLGDADTSAEADSLRAQLRDANVRIQAGQVALRQIDRRASYARVDVSVQSAAGAGAADDADDGSGWGVGDAWGDARRGLEVAAGVAVIVLAAVAPLALLGLLGAGGRRTWVSRARRRALDTA